MIEFDDPCWDENKVEEYGEGKNVYIPNELFNQSHIHRKKEQWVRLWFYKNRKKYEVKPNEIQMDYDITSKLEYQKGTFYKISQLSHDDNYFDYYYKLKTGLPKDIFKKNNRYKTPISSSRINPRTKSKKPVSYCEKMSETVNCKINTDGSFVVMFE
jgi:hypothetical protein